MLLCLHVEESVSGFEEGGSLFMQNTENICMLCFVCSQLGYRANEHITTTWIRCDVSVGHQVLYKSKCENKFPFL